MVVRITKKDDKRDDFDIVNFPFLDEDIPRASSYGVYTVLLECLVVLLIFTLEIKV